MEFPISQISTDSNASAIVLRILEAVSSQRLISSTRWAWAFQYSSHGSFPTMASKLSLTGWNLSSYLAIRDIFSSRFGTFRLAGDNGAGPVIHSRQSLPPFDWLHFPHAGTRLCISDMKPVGLLPLTMGLRWSHSVAGSPQYAHRTSSGPIPRTRRASSTSSSEGFTTGMMPLTNELVIVEVLPAIDTGLGILNAFEAARPFIGSFRKEGPQHCYGPKTCYDKIK